jgi:ankyrin repeat protein
VAKSKEPPSSGARFTVGGVVVIKGGGGNASWASNAQLHNQSPFDGWTPLTIAAYHGDEVESDKLIGRFTTLERENGPGITPLIASAMGGHVNVTRMLLQHGADPRHVVRLFEDTVLMAAAFRGAVDVASLLLDLAPDLLNQANVNGYTPLMAAAIEGHEPMVQMLIERGAGITQKTLAKHLWERTVEVDGRSHDLPYVTSEPFPHLRRSISSHAYRIIHSDKRELTAMMLASQFGHENIVSIIRNFETRSVSTYEIPEQIEKSKKIPYDLYQFTKGLVPNTTSITNAQTQFFAAVGITDNRLRGLVAGVVKAAIDGDEMRLSRVQEALDVRQAPATLPTKAPELYRDRGVDASTGKREDIEQFLTRVYKAELDAGVLTAPALSRLDIAAYGAFRENRARFPNLNIPSKSELMAREKADPELIREAQRLAKRSYRERVSGLKREAPRRGG